MTVTDRMGGFISASIIETKNVHAFVVENNLCTVIHKTGKSFIELDVMKNGITPNISVSDEKSGQIWNIDVQVDLKNESGLKIIPFNKFLLILENPVGEKYIFGTMEFPLCSRKHPILSSSAAGKMGETLSFTGKQPFYPYKMTL